MNTISSLDLMSRIMQCPLQAYSRQELWHAYLSHIQPGDECLEFGVARGKSINHMARVRPRTIFWGFDSFDGLPETWQNTKKGHFKVDVTKLKFAENVSLQKGSFENTLPQFLATHDLSKLKGIHVDCDLGSSTRTIFSLLSQVIQDRKPILLFDEFFNYRNYDKHEFGVFLDWVNANNIEFKVLGRVVTHQQVLVQLV